ncbi:unnamed protein product [Didymodactylos carnosus]|uniref:Uncharacterized protein n=1 Tax=Didymodactylos carnosus TaxID=1234261 RepID=A0A8S2GVQ9_9BILA|nr:unnamed protein product [Didymodactylos carnosus]CAF3545060.1 unnamed protein product [Didymodactylos carnosus]
MEKSYRTGPVGKRNFYTCEIPVDKRLQQHQVELNNINSQMKTVIIIRSNIADGVDAKLKFCSTTEIKKNGKCFFFIRTNIEQDLYNEKVNHPSTFNETLVLHKIRENCLQHIRTVDDTANVFLISGPLNYTTRFDFPAMCTALLCDYPGLKRQILILAMSTNCKAVIRAKVNVLRGQTWVAAAVSAAVAAPPKQLGLHNKRFLFIRSNIDSDLYNEYEDHPSTFNEEQILTKIRNNCLEYIRTVDENAEVFLISGHLRNNQLYDFGKLTATLLRHYPSLKRESMILSIIRSRAAIPVPFFSLGFDPTIVMAEAEFYKKQFGLDQAALEKLSQGYRISMQTIERELNEIFPLQHLNTIRAFVIEFAKRQAVGATAEEFARFVPYVGTAVASTLSFGVCYLVLYKILTRMRPASFEVIDIVIDASNRAIQEQQQRQQQLL